MAALLQGELRELPGALRSLDLLGRIDVGMTCVVGFAICFTGIWAQSLISATSFLAPGLKMRLLTAVK